MKLKLKHIFLFAIICKSVSLSSQPTSYLCSENHFCIEYIDMSTLTFADISPADFDHMIARGETNKVIVEDKHITSTLEKTLKMLEEDTTTIDVRRKITFFYGQKVYEIYVGRYSVTFNGKVYYYSKELQNIIESYIIFLKDGTPILDINYQGLE